MKVLKIKGDLDNLLKSKYGFDKIKYVNFTVYLKNLENGNNYRISELDNGIIHFNQNTVNNELDDTIFNLIQDGLVEICKR